MIGLAFFGIFFIVGIGSLVLAIMTAVSASKYPDWAFQQTATSKFIWVGVPLILLLVCGLAGGVMGLIWFTSKREQVERAAQSGASPYGYGAPPQLGYGGPQYGAPQYGAPQPGQGAPQSGWGPPPAPPGYPPPWTPPTTPGPQQPPPSTPPAGEPPPPPPAPQQ